METSEMFGKRAKGTWRDVLFVDPGLGGTGWAFWHKIKRPSQAALPPNQTGVIKSKAKDWIGKFSAIDEIFADIQVQDVFHVVIEATELWATSSTSMSAASRGNLFKLAHLTGGLMEVALNTWLCDVILVPARTWKGQLNDKAVDARIKRALGRRYRRHEAEAVGMGLAAQGVL